MAGQSFGSVVARGVLIVVLLFVSLVLTGATSNGLQSFCNRIADLDSAREMVYGTRWLPPTVGCFFNTLQPGNEYFVAAPAKIQVAGSLGAVIPIVMGIRILRSIYSRLRSRYWKGREDTRLRACG